MLQHPCGMGERLGAHRAGDALGMSGIRELEDTRPLHHMWGVGEGKICSSRAPGSHPGEDGHVGEGA